MRPLFILLLLVLLWVAWDLFAPLFGVRQTPPWRLRRLLAGDRPPLLVDVRTPQEFRMFHIPGARNLPFPPDPEAVADLAGGDRSRPVVVICMTGHRSPPAVRRLRRAGFTDAANLTWGLSLYALLGGKVVSGKD